MNYNHLNYFFHVAKLQNMTKAASVLRISQPSLSAQIKTFEGSIGKTLFQKVGRNIELTMEGQMCLKYCEKIFSLTDELQNYLSGEVVSPQKKIIIGMTKQVAGPFAADLVSSLKDKNWSAHENAVIIKSESKENLLKKIEMGEVDLMLTNTATYSKGCVEIVNREMPVALFCNAETLKKIRKEFNYRNELDLKKLVSHKDFSMVIPSRDFNLRHEIDFFLNQFSVKPMVSFESDILSSVEKAIVDGLGWGFVPEQYFKGERAIRRVQKINTKQRLWKHRLCLVARAGFEKNDVVQALRVSIENL